MSLLKISGIFSYISFSLLFYNTRLVYCILTLEDIQIKEYYIGSSEIPSLKNNSRFLKREISSKNEIIFPLQLIKNVEPFKISIRRRKSDLIFENTRVFHISRNNNFTESPIRYYLEDSNLYEGFILDYPHNSSISGYIKESCFYGHVIINNTFYYVDELNHLEEGILTIDSPYPEDNQEKRNALIYSRHSLIFNGFRNMIFPRGPLVSLTNINFHKIFQQWKGKGMLCTLVIVIDYSYLTQIHGGNVKAAIFQVLFSLEEANSIFRSTDFDGDGVPDNIGFYVKKMVIISSDETLYFIPKYTPDLVNVIDFITKFRRYEELQDHCLGIIFTTQKFQLKTLGASFSADNEKFIGVGGICETFVPGKGSFNAVVITAMTENLNPVPQVVFEITIAHELGHSFGASHDEEKNKNCFGSLMSPKTFKDYEENIIHMKFSFCSKEQVLRTLVARGQCLEPVKFSFCGNGIVEDDEQCDCGLTKECLKRDPCCIPRRTNEYPCRVNKKRGFECHPSQGECCTKQCKYSTNLSKYVNCKNFDGVCPCPMGETNCSCGINGMCIEKKCHSIECTRINLSECQCQQEKTKGVCSVCCEYNNECMPVIEVTEKLINEERNEKIFSRLFAKKGSTVYQGGNWVSKNICHTPAKRCTNLYFFQGNVGEYCLRHGKLGKCSVSFDCKIVQSRQSFPVLESRGEKVFSQLGVVKLVFYFTFNAFINNILF